MEKNMAKKAISKFMQPMKVSTELAEVVGKGPMPRTEVTKKTLGLHQKTQKARPR